MRATTALAALAALPSAFAHYNFESLIVNGQVTEPYKYVRRTTNSNSPIENVSSPNIVCNQGGNDANIRAATQTYTVSPGDTLGFAINSELGHPGPQSVYMSKAPNGVTAQNYLGDGDWFKVYSLTTSRIDTNTGLHWATFPNSQGVKNFTFTLPRDTPPGEYLLRGEHIALHGAGNVNGAQFYIGCAQIKVTGNGSGSPGPTIKLPGGYSPNHPGVLINIYWPPPQSYTPIGPATWPGKCEDHTVNLLGSSSDGDCTPSRG